MRFSSCCSLLPGQAMEAERTRVGVARERALVIQQEAQTEHQRAVMAVSYKPPSCWNTFLAGRSCQDPPVNLRASPLVRWHVLRAWAWGSHPSLCG